MLLASLALLLDAQPRVMPSVSASRPDTVKSRVTRRPGNRLGSVLVLMYHRTGDKSEYMVRSKKQFRADIERLYRLGYRPVTLAEYSMNKMPLPRGASPVVLTFDDSAPSQFRLLPNGQVDPNCMVGIWQSFAKKHPDFPVKGTFFVLPNGPFGQSKLARKKLDMLRGWGSEIGSHTVHHHALNKLSDADVVKELALSYRYVEKLGFEPTSLALPYGNLPKNRELTHSFRYNGREYRYWNVCLAGYNPAPSPLSPKFNRFRIPRVQAYDGEFGINYWLNRNKKYPHLPYVQP